MIPIVIHGLHQLPNIYIELVLILFNLALFVAAPLALRRALHIEIHEDVAKGADDAFKTLVALTMAMTAFALVQVEGLHRNVGDLVSREGAILLKFDRTIEDFGGPLAPAAEQRLRDYAASVRQSEWPAMASGGRSADTSARLAALSASVDQLLQGAANDKNLSGELSGQLIQLKDVREARVASSYMGLSPYLWLGITVAMLTLAVLGWFQAPARKAVPYLIGIVIGLSTLLTVLVVSSGIFEGESRVAPDAIARTIDAIDASRGPAAQRPPPAPVR